MKGSLQDDLQQSILTLTSQDSSAKTIHRALFGLRKTLDAKGTILVLKNPQSDYLQIKNHVNIPLALTQEYHRPIGNQVIGKLFYTTDFLMVSGHGNQHDYQDLHIGFDYELAIAARVAVDNQAIGFLGIYFDYACDLDQNAKNLILAQAGIISEAIRKERLLNLVNQLRRYDEETGLLCHDFFMHKLDDELKKSERYKYALSLSIMDIDNFKDITNLHGMAMGRQLFREIAEELKFSVRGVDVIGLFGTDEFILFLPNTALENAKTVLQRFRKRIVGKMFTAKKVETALSIGLTSLGEKESLKDLVWRAQTALYNARLLKKGALKILP
jgi:diguanylate cyclase (GGDEF)-like protein